MALTRGKGSRLAVQVLTVDGELVDVPAFLAVDSNGNAVGPGGGGASNPSTIVTGQLALTASTGSNNRGQLPSNALVNGVVITAKSTNAASVLIGGATVTTAEDGTGSGYPLAPGASISFGVSNTNAIYAISTAAAVLSIAGN